MVTGLVSKLRLSTLARITGSRIDLRRGCSGRWGTFLFEFLKRGGAGVDGSRFSSLHCMNILN
jgi:hypothetical protein